MKEIEDENLKALYHRQLVLTTWLAAVVFSAGAIVTASIWMIVGTLVLLSVFFAFATEGINRRFWTMVERTIMLFSKEDCEVRWPE